VRGQRMVPATQDGRAIQSTASVPIVWKPRLTLSDSLRAAIHHNIDSSSRDLRMAVLD
jgi:hypothetical protein